MMEQDGEKKKDRQTERRKEKKKDCQEERERVCERVWSVIA